MSAGYKCAGVGCSFGKTLNTLLYMLTLFVFRCCNCGDAQNKFSSIKILLFADTDVLQQNVGGTKLKKLIIL